MLLSRGGDLLGALYVWDARVIASRRSKPRRRPVLVSDPAYRNFIGSMPCRVCYEELYRWADGDLTLGDLRELSHTVYGRQKSRTEVAHVGDRGRGQKCPDSQAIPLCGIEHHREGPKSHHVLGKGFWAHHGLDREAVIRQLNEAYERGVE